MTGLEALNKIQHDFGQLKGQELVNCYEIIWKSLKALEIIKEKKIIDIKWLKSSRNYKEYNSKILDVYNDITSFLTEEEFNLLKEALE